MHHGSPGHPYRRVQGAGPIGRYPALGQRRAVRRLGRLGALLAATGTTVTVALAAVVASPDRSAAADAGALELGVTTAASIGDRIQERHIGPGTGDEPGSGTALPRDSGSGKRVVFDMSEQRVWLVGAGGRVRRTYEVSGSRHDNLDPGSYEVYSRSRHAVAYDHESTMDYFVRFTKGDNAAIGFHDLPRDRDGELLQTRSELGEPRSSGCIRQARPDAVALWRYAPVGTSVVVVN